VITAGVLGAGAVEAAEVKMGGYTIEHTHHQESERTISSKNVGTLRKKWEHVTCGTVDSTPAIVDGAIYVTDRGGCVHKLDRDGHPLWSEPRRIPALLAGCGISAGVIPPDIHSRNSPLVMGKHLIFGTLRTSAAISNDLLHGIVRNSAYLLAMDKDTGECLWARKVHDHPAAVVTQSAVGFDNKVCVGVSSLEEFISTFQDNLADGVPFLYSGCCTFRGKIACYDTATGNELWHLNTISDDFYYDDPNDAEPPAAGLVHEPLVDPANGRLLRGNAGVAVWGLTHPAIDRKRQTLYFATGNNYRLSQAIFDEVRRRKATGLPLKGDPTATPPLPPLYRPMQNMLDAVAAVDLETGRLKWIRILEDFDPHVGDCIINDVLPGAGLNCPFADNHGRDADFGQQPALIRNVRINGTPQDIVAVCQKSGVCYALSPETGKTVWQTDSFLSSAPGAKPVCPGGEGGGFQQALATDGERIYVSCGNDPVQITRPWLFKGGQFQNGVRQDGTAQPAPPVCASFWIALDAGTGELIWQTTDPLSVCVPGFSPVPVPVPDTGITLNIPAVKNFGPATIANGVVYVGSMPSFPYPEPPYTADMYALDAKTGRILWTFKSGASVGGGPAIADGLVVWGTGYPRSGVAPRIQKNRVFGFELPARSKKLPAEESSR
jgi:polyvinyl alcohol dehydrogenase (cytochrome)